MTCLETVVFYSEPHWIKSETAWNKHIFQIRSLWVWISHWYHCSFTAYTNRIWPNINSIAVKARSEMNLFPICLTFDLLLREKHKLDLMDWSCFRTQGNISTLENKIPGWWRKGWDEMFHNLDSFSDIGTRDSVLGIATGYALNERGVGVRVPVGSRIFSSPRRPDRLCGPSSFLYNWYQGLSPMG
jgi:hypothetical protein